MTGPTTTDRRTVTQHWLRLEGRLDDVVHRAFQMAVLGLLRGDSADLGALEDVRLAMDEVLLGAPPVPGRHARVDVTSSRERVVLRVEVQGDDLDVPRDLLAALVDEVDVECGLASTTVSLARSW